MRLLLLVGLAGCEQLLSLPAVPPPRGGGGSLKFVQAAVWTEDLPNAPQIDLPVTLNDAADLCIVTVGLDGTAPTIASVTYAGTAMNELVSVTGIPGTTDDDDTVSKQWWLADPALASGDVVVTMGTPGLSSQVNALFFAGANQAQPFRDMQATSGTSDHTELTVMTSPGDLVESVTGQGSGVSGVGAISSEVFVHNVDDVTSLNNSGGSVTPATGPSTTIVWQYTGADRFQTLAATIAPAD